MNILIGTYNLQHGILHRLRLQTGEFKVDLADVTAVLRDVAPDLCALNEIYGSEDGDFGNQPRLLAETLGYPYHAFARGIYHKYGEYGNGLLSKYPIRSLKDIPLVIPPEKRTPGATRYEDRVLLIAELELAETILTAMVCHFGLYDDEKSLAVDTIITEAKKCTTPVLLMGDFNITPDTTHYARLAAHFTDTAALTADPLLTFPSDAPVRKIDYIFTKGNVTPKSIAAPAVVASDHLPLFAKIELPV